MSEEPTDGEGEGEMSGLEVTACERCPELCASRSRIVNGTGAAETDLVFVGEAPGAQEDEQGEPFVGRSGSVLDAALDEHGVDRADVRITNCVRCRPPENRDPTKDELASCKGYLSRELERVDPELVVTLGKVPSEHLLGRSVAVTKEAGEVSDARIGDRAQKVLVSVHPAATLYDSSQKETFSRAIGEALSLVGLSAGGEGGGQSRLGEF
jgi:DNA polymerase